VIGKVTKELIIFNIMTFGGGNRENQESQVSNQVFPGYKFTASPPKVFLESEV